MNLRTSFPKLRKPTCINDQLQNTATVKNSIRRSSWRNAFPLIALAASAALAPVGLRAAPGDIFVSVNGNTQDGGGFVYKYTPIGVQSTFASGLSRPRGVAFDSIGNLFVANTTFDGTTYQATIVKITPRGVQSTFATLSSNFWAEGLAFDSSGSLFVAAGDTNDPNLGSTIFKFTPDGTQSTFGSVPSVIIGLAFDSAGNLCVPDFWGVSSKPSGSLRPTAQKAYSLVHVLSVLCPRPQDPTGWLLIASAIFSCQRTAPLPYSTATQSSNLLRKE